MPARFLLPTTCALIALTWWCAAADSPQAQSIAAKSALPGARSEIDAAKFPTLQAALGASTRELVCA